MTELTPDAGAALRDVALGLLRPARRLHQLHAQALAGALPHAGPRRPHRSRSWSATASPSSSTARSTTSIATGVYPDMTEHGWDRDDWPEIFAAVQAADILVLTTPIWLGEKSSVCTRVIERLYGNSHLLNDAGQYAYYGRVGGCLVTGNEDGVKHCAMNVLYSLQHLGFTIPPQADAGWIGEAGPGPSYLDPGSGGPGQRLHQPQRDVHDLEPAALRADAQGRRRRSPRTATSGRPGTRAAGCDYANPEYR